MFKFILCKILENLYFFHSSQHEVREVDVLFNILVHYLLFRNLRCLKDKNRYSKQVFTHPASVQ